MTDELGRRLAAELKTNIDAGLVARLHEEAENAKIRLSRETETRVVIPRSNPVDPYTMGSIARDADLTPDEFRRLL